MLSKTYRSGNQIFLVVDSLGVSDKYESVCRFFDKLSSEFLLILEGLPSEETFLRVFFSLHCNSVRQFGIVTKTGTHHLVKLSEFKNFWISLDEKIQHFLRSHPEKKLRAFVHYCSTNGIFIQSDLKEVEKRVRFLDFQVPSCSLCSSKIPKSLIYWIFESQHRVIEKSIDFLCNELRRCQNEIRKEYSEKIKDSSSSSPLFQTFSEISKSFLSQNVIFSHSLLSSFFIDLVLKYDKTPDFHSLYSSKFPSSFKNKKVKELENEPDFPFGVYCFNIDGDCYVIHYLDSNARKRVVVVDGGRSDESSMETVWSFFVQFGIQNIDLWILTHRDEDHVGTFVMFLKGFSTHQRNQDENENSYFPKINRILYRRHLLEKLNPFDESDDSIVDKYREKYRFLSVRNAVKESEEITFGVEVLDPDLDEDGVGKKLHDLSIELLPREKPINGRKVWEKIGGITGENFYSLSAIVRHHGPNKTIYSCVVSGDVKEGTIMEKLKVENSSKFFFADLPMHGNLQCCSEDNFLGLDVQHFVCTRNKKNPAKKVRNCLMEKNGFVFLPGFGREIVFDRKMKNGKVLKISDIGFEYRLSFSENLMKT